MLQTNWSQEAKKAPVWADFNEAAVPVLVSWAPGWVRRKLCTAISQHCTDLGLHKEDLTGTCSLCFKLDFVPPLVCHPEHTCKTFIR